jgi:hypothetical protein
MPPYTSRHASQSLRRPPAPAIRFERSDFTDNGDHLAACARDLGWPPGDWAKVLYIDGVLYRRDWAARSTDPREGELLSVPYVPALNGHPSLVLFND